MTFIELFAGVGGFRLGLERSGHQCVWSNEWLEKPRRIYERHFGEQPDPRDIRTVPSTDIPDAEIVCGGFPCATFSVAGKRTGFAQVDTRGTLFFEICRILRDKQPHLVLLENVAGLLTHDSGRTFGIILAHLDEAGYDCQWEVLNSRNFGIPQNRERVFIVGNLRGKSRPEVFPLGRCGTADGEQGGSAEGEGKRFQGACVGTLDAHYYKRGSSRTFVQDLAATQEVPQAENTGLVAAVLTPFRPEKRQRGRRIKSHNEPAFTLTAQDRHGVQVGSNIRMLTPLECEKLQGLPPEWTKYYSNGELVPDKERYERCGRTVTIPIIEEIGKRLK